MRILMISSSCSEKKYNKIISRRTKKLLDSGQKFFLSIVDGLKTIEGINIDCLTSLPISFGSYPDRLIADEDECYDNVCYHYIGCMNLPFIRTIDVGFRLRRYVKKYIKNHVDEKTVIVCDVLNAEATSVVNFAHRKDVMTVAIVTDIPSIVGKMVADKGIKALAGRWYSKKADKQMKRFDKYVLLTEQMNTICNLMENLIL